MVQTSKIGRILSAPLEQGQRNPEHEKAVWYNAPVGGINGGSMKTGIIFGTLALGLVFMWTVSASAQADVANGQTLFNQKCANCHSLSADPAHGAMGPNLMGVIGRTAGTVEGWTFSPALKDSKLVLNEENLNKWLNDPEGTVPGTVMTVKVPNKFEREDLIGYIKKATEDAKK
jgi:cytochrome c